MIEKLEILRISFLDVDIGDVPRVLSFLEHQFAKAPEAPKRPRQFDVGLTCKNELPVSVSGRWIKSHKCFSPAQVENLRHRKDRFRVSPHLHVQAATVYWESICASRQLCGIYRPAKEPDTIVLLDLASGETCDVLAKWTMRSKSEIPKIPKGKRLIFVNKPK